MARKKQTIKIEQNDKLFKALIENSWDVVLLIDKKARVIYASPSIVRMFGRDYHKFTGVNGIKFIHPIDAPRVAKAFAQIVLNPREPIHMEMRIRHNLGHYLWIEAIATNFLTDKNIKGIIINFHDITELKKIDERKDEFISIASHELKTPITSLKVYLQLFRKNFKIYSPSKIENFLDKMFSQVQRLERFVNDIYDAARIREGKLSLSFEKFKILLLIKETADDIERNYGTHKIILTTKFNGSIIADRMRIQQVLINLLVNAMKFSPSANKIIIKLWKKEKNIFVSVTDFGTGITKENIAKIAERFYQADVTTKTESGLGLGLYIAYNIIKQHKGDFFVRSKGGKSTTVTFCLPQK